MFALEKFEQINNDTDTLKHVDMLLRVGKSRINLRISIGTQSDMLLIDIEDESGKLIKAIDFLFDS